MNVDDMYSSKYLKSDDLKGRTVMVTIESLAKEEVGRDKDVEWVATLRGKDKRWVLNKTNLYLIAQIHGKETEDWPGKEVELYAGQTSMDGKPCLGIRVRVPPPAGEADDADIPF